MKQQHRKALAIFMMASFALTMTLTVGATTTGAPPDRGRFVMPFGVDPDTGQRVLSFEEDAVDDANGFDEEAAHRLQAMGQGRSDKAWMLDPQVFNQLSSGGQRTALLMTGLLRIKGRQGQPGIQPEELRRPVANPGDNVRVNDPTLDTSFHTHSETSIANNGPNVVVSFNAFNFSGSSGAFSGFGVSHD